MRRVLCVYFPQWSIDLAKLRRGRSARPADTRARILVGRRGATEVVSACCERARASGVRLGMTLSHARSLLRGGEPLVEPHQPERDLAALRRAACWAQRFSPLVAIDPPDGLLLDITGCQRFFRGERRLAEMLAGEVRRRGFSVRVAVSSTTGCSWGVARFGPQPCIVVPPGAEKAALADLPLTALRVPENVIAAVSPMGLTRVGHLYPLSRADLADRFDGVLLRRLDEALGLVSEGIEPLPADGPLCVERVFADSVIQREALTLAAWQLVEELARRLIADALGVLCLELALAREKDHPVIVSIRLSRPSRDARHLWSLLAARLENTTFRGGVESMRLTAKTAVPLAFRQLEHETLDTAAGDFSSATDPPESGELIDTLVSHLGEDAVCEFDLLESLVPERVLRRRMAMVGRKKSSGTLPLFARPSILLPCPRPVEVMRLTPDGPLMSLRCDGQNRDIIFCAGPERIRLEWWQEGKKAIERDYFRVQGETGRWMWLFHELPAGRWFVHGEWV